MKSHDHIPIKNPFVTAEWRRLILANYAVDEALLLPYLPAGTELDRWEGQSLVSLVGFAFLRTRMLGLGIPFHRDFGEVNLRFYVRRHVDGAWRRGVVFIREIVSLPALALTANLLYREKYTVMPLRHRWEETGDALKATYAWKKGRWHSLSYHTRNHLLDMPQGSEAEFITEHYWGYTRYDDRRTVEYPVWHPRWQVYPAGEPEIDVDFGAVYGPQFAFLTGMTPQSIFMAEGSEIAIGPGKILKQPFSIKH